MLRPTYPITTPRLALRPFTPADLDALYKIQSRPDVMEHLYEQPRTADEARETLQRYMAVTALEKEGDALRLAVTVDGQVIGHVMLEWLSEANRGGEIGFVLHPDHHGRGYATEAGREMLRLGFDGLGLHRIIGRLDAANTASGRVLAKLGMRKEAHFVKNEWVKGRWADEAVYAMLADEWSAR
ncbi:GNAT family N-acetyltransferase [Actinokineospora guangxiensis]|uniref:GNAT family N-acetyltransferase n=1 Tax=Actinokineospora guangxiensis TaxID=1490288 RepID=A0ABW0EW54_9PSEU